MPHNTAAALEGLRKASTIGPALSPLERFTRAVTPGAGGVMPIERMESGVPSAKGIAARGIDWLRGLSRAAPTTGRTLDIVEDLPVRQIAPSMEDVDALIGGMRHSLAKIRPQAAPAPSATTGLLPAEFTPPGQEAIYNLARKAKLLLGRR